MLVGFPGVARGSLEIAAVSHAFYGGNVDLSERIIDHGPVRLFGLFGYRYMHYEDSLGINTQIMPQGGLVVPGTTISTADSFSARNQFNGVEGGFRLQVCRGDWFLEALTKVAFGRNNDVVNVNGGTLTTVPGFAPLPQPGGIYALMSNIGQQPFNELAFAADVGLTLGWNVSDHVRLRLGYYFLFWNNVARAGDQVDTFLNRNFFPPAIPVGPLRPELMVRVSDLWAQSITFGVEFRY